MQITLRCSADIARMLASNPRPSFWGNLHAILIKAHDPSEGVYQWPRVDNADGMKGMGGGR